MRYAKRYGRVVIELADHYHFAEYDPEPTDHTLRMVALALGITVEDLVRDVRRQMAVAHG